MAKKNINAAEKHLQQIEDDNNETSVVSNVNSDFTHEPDASIPGWFALDKAKLSYNGVFYPENMRILYRGADTPDVREWSTMDVNNEFDVMEHFNMMLKSCLRVTNGSWKDILEVDRFKLVMLIQEVTYIEIENPVMLDFTCYDCDLKNSHQLQVKHVNAKSVNTKLLDRYLDKEISALRIKTKTHGEILYKPSTIGSADVVFKYLKKQRPSYVKRHQSIIKLLPRFIIDYRSYKDKTVEKRITDWYSWTPSKLAVITELSDELDFAPEDSVVLKCSDKNCLTENSVKIDPEGDLRYMFLVRKSLESELID